MTIFRASHRNAFLDYFRIPYEVGMKAPATDPLGSLAWLGRLDSVPAAGQPSRTLLWLRARASAQLGSACTAGCYRLGDAVLSGHVIPDTSTAGWLRRLGSDWQPTQPIRDAHGRHVASVWRDDNGSVFLPFDMGEVMENFWSERYRELGRPRGHALAKGALIRGYYMTKPAIPRQAQLALRRSFTRVQSRATFPRWPVEDSLHDLYSWLLGVLAVIRGLPVPYLSVWPEGRSWALVLTHDVETAFGYRNLHLLRDTERELGYRSTWNFVPERYEVDETVLQQLRAENCEIGVHGLLHDGRDLGSRRLFAKRLPAIRAYAERWHAVGFRSPATQRVWEWMPELGFDYDSSFTDTDPYEPQPGGCCSYLPFLNEEQVELPITLPQDHTLFAILEHTAGDVWVDKARHLRGRGGMALALTHPDYATNPHLADAWRRLLEEFRDDDTAWQALAHEVAHWWRRRAASTVREHGTDWRVDGPASRDGRVDFATSAQASPTSLTAA